MKEQVVEILAPAGNKDALLAAVRAGADAVYVGGSRFGARAYAANFTEEELLFALDYVHMTERKLYLTVNTLVKQSEIDSVYDFLLPFYRQGLDGVIVQDFGVGTVIRQAFPDMELHASTQMAEMGMCGLSLRGRFRFRRSGRSKKKRAFLWSVSFTGPSVTVIPDSVF